MAEATIDRLSIAIEAEASKGSKGLEKFIQSVEKLRNITSGGMDGLTKLNDSFKTLNATIQPLVEKLNSISAPLKELKASMKGFGATDIGALKMQAEVARLQASLDRSTISSARAQAGLERLAETQRKAADAAKFQTEGQKMLNNALKQNTVSQYQSTGMESLGASPLKGYRMATSVEDLKRAMEGAASDIGRATQQVNEAFNRLNGSSSATLDNINAKLEIQKQKLLQLNQQYISALDKYGAQSTQALDIQGKMLGVENTINNLINKSNRLAEVLRSADSAAANASENQSLQKLSSSYKDITDQTKRVRDSMLGKNKTLKDQTKATKLETTAIGKWADSLGKALKQILLVSVAYKGIRKAIGLVSEGIRSAISAPEIENMFNVAFGSLAYEADQFARKLKDAYGLDVIASKQMLATFQNFNISMGVGSQTANKMSKSLTQLAYDMASLYEVDPKQVFENLQSGLQGMPRALYKYGISITDANIKQTALRHGIGAVGRELTSQEKIIARYITILEQTKTSQGDLARTLESPANQLRIFQSQMIAAARAIGQAFMPVIQAVLPLLNTFAVVLERAGNALARFIYRIFGRDFDAEMKAKQDALKDLTDTVGGVSGADQDLADSMDEAAKAAKTLISGFDELNILSKKMDENITDVGDGAGFEFDVPELPEPTGESPYGKLADELIEKLKALKDLLMSLGLKEVLDNFRDFFKTLWEQFKQYDWKTAIYDMLTSGFEMLMSAIVAVQTVLFPLLEALNIPGIIFESLNTLTALFRTLNDIIRALIPGLKEFTERGLVPIAEWIGEKIIDALKFLQEQLYKIGDWFTAHTQMFTEIGEAAGELVNRLWEILKPILDEGWEKFKETLSLIVDKILHLGEKIGEATIHVFNAANAFLEWADKIGLLDLAISGIKAIVNAFWTTIQTGINTISTLIEAFVTQIESFAKIVEGIFTGDLKLALEGFIQVFTTVFGTATQLISGLINGFLGLVDSVLNQFIPDWDSALSNWWKNNVEKWFSIEQWKNLGLQAVKGLMEGVKGLWDGAISLGKDFIQGFKDALGIHSPSKEMEIAGEYIDAGLAQGIEENVSKVLQAISTLSNAIIDNFNSQKDIFIVAGESIIASILQGLSSDAALEQVDSAITSLINNIFLLMQEAFSIVDDMGGMSPSEQGGQGGGMFYQFGMQFMTDLSAGITDNVPLVQEALALTAETINTDITTIFGISEENSGVFYNYGLNLMQGMSAGIKDNVPLVQDELTALGELIDEQYKAYIGEFTEVYIIDMKKISDVYKDTLNAMKNETTSAVNEMIKDLNKLIKQIEKAIQKLQKLQDMGGSLGKGRSSGRGDSSEGASDRSIPAFANGGVVRSPTYALVGEYQNARSDPEVIAPQSIIEESVVSANSQLVGAMYQMATMIVDAIESNATDIQQDPDAVFKIVRKKALAYKRNTGSSAF